MFEELPLDLPKIDMAPNFVFELRPRFIQAGSEFKLICEVEACPVSKVSGILACLNPIQCQISVVSLHVLTSIGASCLFLPDQFL